MVSKHMIILAALTSSRPVAAARHQAQHCCLRPAASWLVVVPLRLLVAVPAETTGRGVAPLTALVALLRAVLTCR
jgi:hypothetical protein